MFYLTFNRGIVPDFFLEPDSKSHDFVGKPNGEGISKSF